MTEFVLVAPPQILGSTRRNSEDLLRGNDGAIVDGDGFGGRHERFLVRTRLQTQFNWDVAWRKENIISF